MDSETVDPLLAAAIVAAQSSVASMPKASKNTFHDFSYASAEDVVAAGRKLLAKHQLALVRVSSSVCPPALMRSDLGKPEYVGDLHIGWLLIHESGATMAVAAQVPIVAEKARPHDKAAKASETFATGYAILGILMQDRSDGQEIAGRVDDSESVRDEPRCSGAAAHIAIACKERCEAFAALVGANKYDVWESVCSKLGVTSVPPNTLFVSDGIKIKDMLKIWIEKRTPTEREPGDDREVDLEPGDGSPY